MNQNDPILLMKSNSVEQIHKKIEKEFPKFSSEIQKMIFDECVNLSNSSQRTLKIYDFSYDEQQNVLNLKAGYDICFIG